MTNNKCGSSSIGIENINNIIPESIDNKGDHSITRMDYGSISGQSPEVIPKETLPDMDAVSIASNRSSIFVDPSDFRRRFRMKLNCFGRRLSSRASNTAKTSTTKKPLPSRTDINSSLIRNGCGYVNTLERPLTLKQEASNASHGQGDPTGPGANQGSSVPQKLQQGNVSLQGHSQDDIDTVIRTMNREQFKLMFMRQGISKFQAAVLAEYLLSPTPEICDTEEWDEIIDMDEYEMLQRVTRLSFYWPDKNKFGSEQLLKDTAEGSFVIRPSSQPEYRFTLSFRRYGRTLHSRIEEQDGRYSVDFTEEKVPSFKDIIDLIRNYKCGEHSLFFEPLLSHPIEMKKLRSLSYLARSAVCTSIGPSPSALASLDLPVMLKNYVREGLLLKKKTDD